MIELTVATEAAAKALYEASMADYEFKIVPWGDVSKVVQYHWRGRALEAVFAAHQDIARQAWSQGAVAGMSNHDNQILANPYEED